MGSGTACSFFLLTEHKTILLFVYIQIFMYLFSEKQISRDILCVFFSSNLYIPEEILLCSVSGNKHNLKSFHSSGIIHIRCGTPAGCVRWYYLPRLITLSYYFMPYSAGKYNRTIKPICKKIGLIVRLKCWMEMSPGNSPSYFWMISWMLQQRTGKGIKRGAVIKTVPLFIKPLLNAK